MLLMLRSLFSIFSSESKSTKIRNLPYSRKLTLYEIIANLENWVLDFVNLLTVCYNKFVPVVSASSVSFCGGVYFLYFEIFSTSFVL